MENKKVLKSKANKKYYEKNKQKIIEHQKEKRFCTFCNWSYSLYDMSKHNKTIKHIRNVNNEISLKNSVLLLVYQQL